MAPYDREGWGASADTGSSFASVGTPESAEDDDEYVDVDAEFGVRRVYIGEAVVKEEEEWDGMDMEMEM